MLMLIYREYHKFLRKSDKFLSWQDTHYPLLLSMTENFSLHSKSKIENLTLEGCLVFSSTVPGGHHHIMFFYRASID